MDSITITAAATAASITATTTEQKERKNQGILNEKNGEKKNRGPFCLRFMLTLMLLLACYFFYFSVSFFVQRTFFFTSFTQNGKKSASTFFFCCCIILRSLCENIFVAGIVQLRCNKIACDCFLFWYYVRCYTVREILRM